MHRTRTTATLLVTVAVSALAGCVTVRHPAAPGPLPAASVPAVPPRGATGGDAGADRQGAAAGRRVGQAPAVEALERVGTDRGRRAPATPAPRRTVPAAPGGQPPDRSRPQPRPHPRPARPEHRHPAPPHGQAPDARPDARGNSGVCGLGKRYGGWRADSPEAVICEQVYGR
ncbi:hypothetical protein ACH4F6_26955 [Streptomyces sp. NPDC017936]|uniref:hypothetical protein n=1 Tax=Streptomyces sp. NPDC017936 TaxID=3365016 RepID=UPI00378E23B2